MRAAAEKLHVSQPSVSAQINQIEDSLGVALFQQVGRGLVLTDAGRLAMEYADDIFSTAREMVRALKDPSGAKVPVFNVGVMDSLPKLLVLALLKPVLAMDPPVRASPRPMPSPLRAPTPRRCWWVTDTGARTRRPRSCR